MTKDATVILIVRLLQSWQKNIKSFAHMPFLQSGIIIIFPTIRYHHSTHCNLFPFHSHISNHHIIIVITMIPRQKCIIATTWIFSLMFGLIACFPEKASWSLWLDVFWWSLCIVMFVFWCRWFHHHYKCKDCISWQGGLDWKTMFGFAQVVQQFLQLLHHNHYHDHYPLQSIITNTFPDVWTRQESILSCTHSTPFTRGWTQLRHGLIFYWNLMIVMFALNFNNFLIS